MPFFDRFWELRLVGAAALSYFAGLAILSWAPESYQFEEEFHRTNDSYLMFAVGGLFLLFAIGIGISAYYAQRRKWMRRRTLKGTADLMPLAKATPDPAKAPDVTVAPLEVMWRVTRKWRRSARWFVAFAGFIMLVYLIVVIFSALNPSPDPYNSAFISWPVVITNSQFSTYFLPVLQMSYPALIIGFLLPAALARPTGVILNADVVVWRTEWGRRRFMRWEDARLFEAGVRRLSDQRYILYGSRSYVRIEDFTSIVAMRGANRQQIYEPDGISQDEMTRRLSEALNVIAARTGLPLRTPYISLRRAGRPAPSASRAPHDIRQTERRWPTLLAFALSSIVVGIGCAALGAVVILWPLSSISSLNLISGVAFGALGLVTIFYGVVLLPVLASRERSKATPTAPGGDLLPARLFTMPGEVYIYRLPGLRTLNAYLIALWTLIALGGVAGVPAMAAFISSIVASFTASNTSPATALLENGQSLVSFFLVTAGLGGLINLVRLFTPKGKMRREARADASGLHVAWGTVTLSMPWEVVETLTLTTKDGQPQSYRVSGAAGKFAFRWSAGGEVKPSAALLPDGGVLLSGRELACLIARQSGVALVLDEAATSSRARAAELQEMSLDG